MKIHIKALLDKYRSAVILAVFICFAVISQAQVYQGYPQYGGQWKRIRVDSLMSLPTDTFTVPAAQQIFPQVALKNDSLYVWSPISLKWKLVSTTGNAYSSCDDKLIDGGGVTYSGSGLKFYIAPSIARFNCDIYTTLQDSVTLDASDPDDP